MFDEAKSKNVNEFDLLKSKSFIIEARYNLVLLECDRLF